MKKILPIIILFLFACVLWNVFASPHGLMINLDDTDFDGPLGVVFGALLAGSGLLLAGVIVLLVGMLLTVLFAGLGALLILGLALGAVALAAALSPLMLPLLIPAGIFWIFHRRARREAKALPAA
jgi:hypothetical protein